MELKPSLLLSLLFMSWTATCASAQQGFPSTVRDDSREIAIYRLQHTQCDDMLRSLTELGLGGQAALSTDAQANALLVRASSGINEQISALVTELDHPADKSSTKPISGFIRVSVPWTAQLSWAGGRGGLAFTPSGAPPRYDFMTGSSGTFRIADIPNFSHLIVQATVDIPHLDRETVAVMQANLVLPLLSLSDLEPLAQGARVTKAFTGPHGLSSEHPQLFEEVASYDASAFADARQSSAVVATVHLLGVVAPQPAHSETSRSANAAPDAVEQERHVSELVQQLQMAEEEVVAIAEFAAHDQDVAAKSVKHKLLAKVAQAFSLRQQLQRAQIELQRTKLELLEQRIARRDQNAKQIIQHRVDELSQTSLGLGLKSMTSKAIEAAKDADNGVTIEVVPELDLLMLRGTKQDVDRIRQQLDLQKSEATETSPEGTTSR